MPILWSIRAYARTLRKKRQDQGKGIDSAGNEQSPKDNNPKQRKFSTVEKWVAMGVEHDKEEGKTNQQSMKAVTTILGDQESKNKPNSVSKEVKEMPILGILKKSQKWVTEQTKQALVQEHNYRQRPTTCDAA